LNVDTEEFGPNGVMPSVENIAKVVFGILEPAVEKRGGSLRHATVWETDRTSCTYPADAG
ncbi:MAG: 6-carboxytetrahydropterin synthase, partial [Planctomycetota bacterium]